MAGGDGQSGTVGATLASPLAVLVTDADGNPVQGVTVHWDPAGAGSVSATTVQSGDPQNIGRVLDIIASYF